MDSIAFVDTEIEPKSGRILDIGCIRNDGTSFHKNSIAELSRFLTGTQFICGHNILNHDIRYIDEAIRHAGISVSNVIDTLFLSPLLFPTRPYHALVKDDKLQTEEVNNPLNDSIKAKDLFFAEMTAFQQADKDIKQIYYALLNNQREFKGFFRFLAYTGDSNPVKEKICTKFKDVVCENADLQEMIAEHPIELAYCLSLINANDRSSIIPPWVTINYPKVAQIMLRLRNKPCLTGCFYCDAAFDIHHALKKYFGFDSFRTYAGEPLQEKAARAAVEGKSILAVFPTGGGKSITFQLPALMAGGNMKGLTVVISPLQSLMKDQVDNLEKSNITEAVTINGLLDPIEREKSLERLQDGSVSILYISPESLRSKTIERLLLGRKIIRFVIDEAHCFSAWGQDFRVDYLYIGDFIKSIQIKKNLDDPIPISCFTATAKQKVIQDIRDYFKDKLQLNLELYTSRATRTNLRYKVLEKDGATEKYQTVRDLIEERNCPTIIYVSRTKGAEMLASRLTGDGFNARTYHGKMDAKEKTENQNAFISGETSIMVATSAFGMGVDKKDVGMVIHYDISDSLENYVQEAGRAGRDEKIVADCFVLFNEDDLSKHFVLLNQTKLSIKEIQQVWRAIKDITKFRSTVSNSALEIARKAGWDDNIAQVETRVTTAIAALEDAGYLKRGQNMPRIFANSILSKNAQEAIEKINASTRFEDRQKENAARIIKKLLSSKSRKQSSNESAESRIDYISDHLGIRKEEVIDIINILREEKILADTKDLTAFIRRGESQNRSLQIVETFNAIDEFLLSIFDEQEKIFHIKELNELAESNGCKNVTPGKLKTILNFWAIKGWIKRNSVSSSKDRFAAISLYPNEVLRKKLNKRRSLSRIIVEILYEKSILTDPEAPGEEILVEFSVHELKTAYEKRPAMFKEPDVDIYDIEDTLFYLSRIEAIKIEGGFLVLYNRLTIERMEQNNKKQYTKGDYQKLQQYYENKVAQIHIVGEYAKKMINDYKAALQFAEDYFQLNYDSFLRKYFPGNKADNLSLKMTPAKFKRLFGELSPTQLKIINDNESRYILIAAGPGSGKTKVLVHKLAALLLMEDVRHEQLLMVTFSRAAVTEFKQRLFKLIGNSAGYVEIKTFHSYCFDLLGKIGSLEKSDDVLKQTIDKIKNEEIEPSRITKTVLVIDEAQDMDQDEFTLINMLMEYNDEMRVIAVGDDDQNIYEFRGSSSKYLEEFLRTRAATKHELIENYRSKANLVDFSNKFVRKISHRLKDIPIIPKQTDNGKIKLIRYQSRNLIIPLIQDLYTTELTGTTCILTKTNEEALQITGLLSRHGLQAKLIQTNDGFNLYLLREVRFFMDQLRVADEVFVIDDEVWEEAKRQLKDKFKSSTKLEICLNLIKNFEITNPNRKYISDLEVFIRESKLEDFFNANGETIFVSTIHKAKGKEFDNVFLMLDSLNANTDEARRQLYVAITRARRTLSIHDNSGNFDNIDVEDLEKIKDDKQYPPPKELAINLTWEDIWLDYFMTRQQVVQQLISGDPLIVNGHECLSAKRQPVLKFSRQFQQKIDTLKLKGYNLKTASINFIVHWKKAGTDQEILVILPELWFERTGIAPVFPVTPDNNKNIR